MKKQIQQEMRISLSPFQIKVYKALLLIPVGETRTYMQVAEMIGKPKAARAVGNACNRNPYPFIVPCHRVVGSNGSLTGYEFGLPLKKQLLEFEVGKKSIKSLVAETETKLKRKFETKIPAELR